MNPYPCDIEQQMQRLHKSLNKKDRRRYAAIEAAKLGWGGISYIEANDFNRVSRSLKTDIKFSKEIRLSKN
jgi:hypothetical protein